MAVLLPPGAAHISRIFSPSKPTGDRFESEDGQLSLLPAADNELIQRLKEIDVNTLTPIEALQTLYEMCKEAARY